MNRPKPFSMIREFHLADWFTLANAFCGVGALFSVMTWLQTGEVLHIYIACALIPLADVISFGVAPAAIAYGCGMQSLFDRIVLVMVLAAAAWQGALGERLWFGVVDVAGFRLHPLVLLVAVSGSLMVSRIRIPKF